jgi:alanine-glyoxylate transaminase/serine-glyoxylate transaminase/serine-pyruvate transaminase
LRLVFEEGLEACWQRHQKNHAALVAGLTALSINYVNPKAQRLPMLNAVLIPAGADDARTRRQLLSDFNIEIGGGLGEFKGKIWRIGLMGNSCRANNVLLFLAALEECLLVQGLKIREGAAVAAANRALLQG